MTDKTRRERLLIIYLCFFTSGLAGLIYEILWNKYLALFIGSTGRAHVMTLAVFMGGLALGSAVFGRRADRVKNPLVIYILLELGVGVCGVAYPFVFEPYRAGFIALARALGLSSPALMAAKLLFCALTILAPTFLMGGTLPVLGRYLVARMADVGPRVATLYYVNTFGAFVGCLLAGFLMIPTAGLRGSMMIAAGLNFVVCLVASVLFRKKYLLGREAEAPEVQAGKKPSAPATAGQPFLYPPIMRTVVFLTIGVSGFVAMLYEIAWIRLLTLVLGASTYSFTLMVATFIFGIGTGSFLLSFKRRETGYDTLYGFAELGLGLSVLAMLPLVERVPYWFNQLVTVFVREPYAFGPYMFMQLLICFLLMLVPTVMLGMTLPAATRIVTEGVRHVGSRVGTVYAINTIGTLLGAAIAGLLFLPWIGLKHTFEVGIILNVATGVVVIWLLAGRPAFWVRALATGASIALVAAYWLAVPQWDKNILSSGIYRQRERFGSFQEMLDMLAKRERVLYYRDGVDASVAVADRQGTRSLLINGKAEASTTGDMGTQVLISHYPLLSRPHTKRVLVIGVGSGVSIGSVLQYPVERVDAVEISKEVVAASTHFARDNAHFYDDTRAAIHLEDAKTFLLLAPAVYDVIISQPSNPWIAGVAGLFSHEFYKTCREHVADNGLFLQWIQTYEIQDAALMCVLRTFTEAFPYFVIWNTNRRDIALMGSTRPFQPDFAWIEEQLARPQVRDDLKRIGIEHPLALLATQMFANTAEPARLFGDAVVNSDVRPYLEYQAPIGFFTRSSALRIKSLDLRTRPRHARSLWIDDYRPATPPSSQEFASFYRQAGDTGSLYDDILADWADRWHAAQGNDPRALEAWIGSRSGQLRWQREQARTAVGRFPDDGKLADLRVDLLFRLLAENNPDEGSLLDEAHQAIERALALDPNRRLPYSMLLLPIAYRQGKMDEVLDLSNGILPMTAITSRNENDNARFELLRMICEAAVLRGKDGVIEECLREARQILPHDDLRLGLLENTVATMKQRRREAGK